MLQAVELTIRLHPDDDVVIARVELATGTLVSQENVRAAVTIPAGHKLAVRDVAQGKPVRRYNQIIGFATRDIKAGEHVHVHNLAMGDFQRDYAFCSLARRLSSSKTRQPSRASCAPTAAWRRATTSASSPA